MRESCLFTHRKRRESSSCREITPVLRGFVSLAPSRSGYRNGKGQQLKLAMVQARGRQAPKRINIFGGTAAAFELFNDR